MLRVVQLFIGLMAVVFDSLAIFNFAHWLSKTDWLMGHTYGPASSIFAALWAGSVGLIGTAMWVAIALFRKFASSAKTEVKPIWLIIQVIQGVIVVLLLVPTAFIVAIGADQLPRARGELQVQHIKAGEASVVELVEALRSPDRGLRFWALQELKKMGPPPKAVVPALAEVLDDPDVFEIHAVMSAEVLAAIGSDAQPAIPALVEAIKREQGKRSKLGSDRPSSMSWRAGEALTKIGPASVPELITLVAHEDRYVRMTAATALGGIGPPAKDAIPRLQQALHDDDESVRQRARMALERIANQRPVAP